jgi:hypothetical protein
MNTIPVAIPVAIPVYNEDKIPEAIPVDNIPEAILVACDKPEKPPCAMSGIPVAKPIPKKKPPCAKRVIAILNTTLLVRLANNAATEEDIAAIRELVNRGVSPHARDDTYQQSAWQRFKFWMNCDSSISHLRGAAYDDPEMLSELKSILDCTS